MFLPKGFRDFVKGFSWVVLRDFDQGSTLFCPLGFVILSKDFRGLCARTSVVLPKALPDFAQELFLFCASGFAILSKDFVVLPIGFREFTKGFAWFVPWFCPLKI